MKTINRFAVVVIPQGPYLTWARAVGDESLADLPPLGEFTSVYLVDERDDIDLDELLGRYYSDIFAEMLSSWYQDESTWPKRRTLAVFREWFAATVVDLVWDMGRNDLVHDD